MSSHPIQPTSELKKLLSTYDEVSSSKWGLRHIYTKPMDPEVKLKLGLLYDFPDELFAGLERAGFVEPHTIVNNFGGSVQKLSKSFG